MRRPQTLAIIHLSTWTLPLLILLLFSFTWLDWLCIYPIKIPECYVFDWLWWKCYAFHLIACSSVGFLDFSPFKIFAHTRSLSKSSSRRRKWFLFRSLDRIVNYARKVGNERRATPLRSQTMNEMNLDDCAKLNEFRCGRRCCFYRRRWVALFRTLCCYFWLSKTNAKYRASWLDPTIVIELLATNKSAAILYGVHTWADRAKMAARLCVCVRAAVSEWHFVLVWVSLCRAMSRCWRRALLTGVLSCEVVFCAQFVYMCVCIVRRPHKYVVRMGLGICDVLDSTWFQ